MIRDQNKEILIFNESIDLFESIDEFIFAVNAEIKKTGEQPVSRQTILAWGRNGIPAERVRVLESATAIPREQFRPDLYL